AAGLDLLVPGRGLLPLAERARGSPGGGDVLPAARRDRAGNGPLPRRAGAPGLSPPHGGGVGALLPRRLGRELRLRRRPEPAPCLRALPRGLPRRARSGRAPSTERARLLRPARQRARVV